MIFASGRAFGFNRRMIGHGSLAERALLPVIPPAQVCGKDCDQWLCSFVSTCCVNCPYFSAPLLLA